MNIFGCGFNGFNQLLPFGSCLDNNIDTSCVLTLRKLHSFPKSNPADTSDILAHPQSTLCNSEYPKELFLSAISVGWDKIALQFGDGHLHISLRNPSPGVASVPQINAKSVAVSWRNTFVVDKDGKCLKLDNSAAGVGTVDVSEGAGDTDGCRFQQVSSGDLYTAVVSDSFNVWCMNNQDGGCILRPISLRQHIKSVSCGKEHVLLLSRIGVVLSMGIGSRGQLGHGDTENQPEPRVVEDLEAVTMVTVSAGGWHSVAISDIGDVYVWGWNESGQLGLPCRTVQDYRDAAGKLTSTEDNGLSSPQTLSSDGARSEDSTGRQCHLTATADGGKCDVINPSGGTTSSPITSSHVDSEIEYVNLQTIPLAIDFPCSTEEQEVMVSKVSCGSRHTAIVTETGELWTWGWNAYGQLGLGDTVSRDVPTRVDRHFSNVQDVHCGCWTTIAVAMET